MTWAAVFQILRVCVHALHSSWKLHSQGGLLPALPLPLGLLTVRGMAENDLLLLCGALILLSTKPPSLCWFATGFSLKGPACSRATSQWLMGDSVVLMKGLYRPLSAEEAALLTGPGTGANLSGAQNAKRLGFLIQRRQGLHIGRH